MATSGTVGQTVFTIQQVIDHAFRRGKWPVEALSGEKIDVAMDCLWIILKEWQNRGCPIWKIQKQILPLYQGKVGIATDVGTIEVLNANLRVLQRQAAASITDMGGTSELALDGNLETACTQTAVDGSIILDFLAPTTITTVGLLPNATATWDFVYEVSPDYLNWETVQTFRQQAVEYRKWLWIDVEITRWPSYRFFRIRAIPSLTVFPNVGLTTLDVLELYIGNTPSAIPLAPINKDDYFNLPNKSFQGRPTQYWQNMERAVPVLNLWPVPDAQSNFYQLELQVHAGIEDIGAMTDELDIPDRWQEALIWTLAEKMADEDPDYKGDIERLERKAKEALGAAWGGITARGPIYIQPNISPYTRIR